MLLLHLIVATPVAQFEPPVICGKTNNVVSKQVLHKPGLYIQAQKMARDWKCWIQKVEELYYPCSEKGADQLRSNCEAYLRPLFSHMQIVGFLMRQLIYKCGRVHIIELHILAL